MAPRRPNRTVVRRHVAARGAAWPGLWSLLPEVPIVFSRLPQKMQQRYRLDPRWIDASPTMNAHCKAFVQDISSNVLNT
ncbi:Protein of unknown function [Azospirillum lipoferum 4B]|uniref:Uncharacterized protein n=1 Tax=Azospirillum lipoferum (strain 4B) TaxID=862719 RepID=G7Z3V9_AZOL4|nr:Protein of unknown function [Azospirillum lipoferum 4B]